MTKNICVYCSASNNIEDVYKDAAKNLGTFIGTNGFRLVYGGGRMGLMGIVADAVMATGGRSVGFIPELLQEKEGAHPHLTELYIVDNMHTRKTRMSEAADIFCILPGGFGTLDELFEIITWRQLNIHAKPILILNINHYWDPLITLVHHVFNHNFAQPEQISYITFINCVEQIMDFIV